MDANYYLIEHLTADYAQRRLAEAQQRRLLEAAKGICAQMPVWCPVVLALARALIALGRRLQAAAEPRRQAIQETC